MCFIHPHTVCPFVNCCYSRGIAYQPEVLKFISIMRKSGAEKLKFFLWKNKEQKRIFFNNCGKKYVVFFIFSDIADFY